MGCNCGQGNVKTSFVYTAPNGQTTSYKTEVEARAAVIRSGGSFKRG